MMQIDHYIALYKDFHEQCGHEATGDACLDKLAEECREFLAAYDSGDHAAIVSERLDVLNTSIFSTYKDTGGDPLFLGFLKLEKTLEKYKKQGKIKT